jgi:threonylcarbamoyladenosine tRNA methylthiotransferase MtaB
VNPCEFDCYNHSFQQGGPIVPTFSIENFGCRATEADAAALRGALRQQGLESTSDPAAADVVVLNTCTVTAAADAQARQAVRKIHRANPAARIVVTGCYAQRAPEEVAALEGVELVVGNSHQREIPRLVGDSARPGSRCGEPEVAFVPLAAVEGGVVRRAQGPARILSGDIFAQASLATAPTSPSELDRTRPILKIQDGCNNRCAYCVIPFVRGASRSLAPELVVRQAQELVAQGAKEIVLSGINLGAYGRDLRPREELASVVERLLRETRIEQLRFSSIEPQDVTEDFVALVASSKRIAPQFHVPLQSGSDRVLRAMHRWYRAEQYARRVEVIHRLLPDAAVGADVIAGFPGEEQEDFAATVKLIERLPFTYLHVFSFSERPGTAAEKRGRGVEAEVIRERAKQLRALGDEKKARFRVGQAGRTMRALTLASNGQGWTPALTGNYLQVRIAGRMPSNQWVDVAVGAKAETIIEPFPRA